VSMMCCKLIEINVNRSTHVYRACLSIFHYISKILALELKAISAGKLLIRFPSPKPKDNHFIISLFVLFIIDKKIRYNTIFDIDII
jgi:hypothetical protein